MFGIFICLTLVIRKNSWEPRDSRLKQSPELCVFWQTLPVLVILTKHAPAYKYSRLFNLDPISLWQSCHSGYSIFLKHFVDNCNTKPFSPCLANRYVTSNTGQPKEASHLHRVHTPFSTIHCEKKEIDARLSNFQALMSWEETPWENVIFFSSRKLIYPRQTEQGLEVGNSIFRGFFTVLRTRKIKNFCDKGTNPFIRKCETG